MKTDMIELFAAKWRLGLLLSTDLSSVAIDAIEAGYDAQSLQMLAGLTAAQSDEAGVLFDRALAELHITVPSKRKAAKKVALEAMISILDGTVTPYGGARRIWQLCRLLEEPLPELDPFIYAASEWEDRPGDRRFFDKEIVDAARAILADCSS